MYTKATPQHSRMQTGVLTPVSFSETELLPLGEQFVSAGKERNMTLTKSLMLILMTTLIYGLSMNYSSSPTSSCTGYNTFLFVCCLRQSCYVALPNLALELCSPSCFNFLSAGIMGVQYYTQITRNSG